jgi:hypothetical protein
MSTPGEGGEGTQPSFGGGDDEELPVEDITTRIAASPFCDLPPDSRPYAEAALAGWVNRWLNPWFPELTSFLKPCWSRPGHEGGVAILRGLKAKVDAAYAPPLVKGQPGKVGAAPVSRVPDIALELEKLQEIFRAMFKRCDSGKCHFAPPPDHIAQEVAQDAEATRTGWGHDVPDLPPQPEPWQMAADEAAQALAAARAIKAQADVRAISERKAKRLPDQEVEAEPPAPPTEPAEAW